MKLSFEGHAKGGVEHVAVDLQELVIAPEYRSGLPAQLTQDDRIDGMPLALHAVLVGAADRLWVTAAADHGERKLVSRTAWRFEEVEPHWSRLVLGGVPLANMREPRDVIVGWRGSKRLPVGVAMFCDAVTTASGGELADPVLHRTITIRHGTPVPTKPITA